jgi:hypothetical protein
MIDWSLVIGLLVFAGGGLGVDMKILSLHIYQNLMTIPPMNQ